MTNNHPDQIDTIRQKIVTILGLETSPDGEPDFLLTYDEDGTVLEGVDYSEEVDRLLALMLKGRVAELKKAFDVDTIPGIPVKPCDDCIGIYEYVQDRIKNLEGEIKEIQGTEGEL